MSSDFKSVITLSGDYFEIGKQLGEYWGNRFFKDSNMSAWKEVLKVDNYELLLKQGWNDKYLPLFKNVEANFPEIITEIYGMAEGINLSTLGITTNIYNLFSIILGETDYKMQCSSVVIKNRNKLILAHNEEDNYVGPLLLCKTELKPETTKSAIKFISCSHPFQLLGSSAGVTDNFAFQGNSIGCCTQHNAIVKSWGRSERIPKTIFTRKLLELNSSREIMKVYSEFNTTLPNHHYIIFEDRAYSLQIRPALSGKPIIGENIRIKKLNFGKKIKHWHTNHFLNNKGGMDCNWSYKRDKDMYNSIDRYDDIESISYHGNIINIMTAMAKKYKNNTSASLFLTKSHGIAVYAKLYFDDDYKGDYMLKMNN